MTEGPETGRPPVGEPLGLEPIKVAHKWRKREALGDVVQLDMLTDIAELIAEVERLRALSVGPETGDRYRLRELARQTATWHHFNERRHGFGHDNERFDLCQHPNCVLVRQAAPAASEGQK